MTNMHLYDNVVRQMLYENPMIETKEILKKITEMGYNGSISIGYENVSKLRGGKMKKTEHQLSTVFWVPLKPATFFILIDGVYQKKRKCLSIPYARTTG